MRTLLLYFVLFVFISSFTFVNGQQQQQPRSFVIDYPNNQFLKDGQPYRYIAGSIHYFRIPTVYWYDRLTKMKAAGLNAIQFYVPWNVHEPTPGQFNFDDNANLLGFLQLAQSLGLDVIMRMGPYTCGEWEAGGFPWWLYKIPNLAVRTSDPRFLYFVNLWYQQLLPMVMPYLYKNGGPVIMMQLENEYGSRPYCDGNYTAFLRDLFRSYVGDDFVLITDDGGALSYLVCGYIPGVYPTVDFGTCSQRDVATSFAAERAYAPQGPLVNTEFYPGWLDLWGSDHSTVPIQPILDTMASMYQMGASFNFYMFEGT